MNKMLLHYNQPQKDSFRVMLLLQLALCVAVLRFLSDDLASADVTC